MEPPRVHHHQKSHHHQEDPSKLSKPPTICAKCGGPTYFSPLPDLSANPSYIPICFSAINLPNPPTNTKEAIIRTSVPQPQKVDLISPPYHFTVRSKIIHSQDDRSNPASFETSIVFRPPLKSLFPFSRF
ncbi:phosphotyrosyl phosphatase activator (PTPA) family protein [Forsythia ovata]|uniref:Phosphotyrosyl phosphatase activator (PTPA) family protein n=1 Tax=Forsythia ovata TaxID=205694 RepID=A0ABD1WF71_9LAMI